MSDARFADGLRYRIELPSVEGPAVLRAVLEEARARDVPVRRVSQGSGVMMLTDAEISEVAELGAEHGRDFLFLGRVGRGIPAGSPSPPGRQAESLEVRQVSRHAWGRYGAGSGSASARSWSPIREPSRRSEG